MIKSADKRLKVFLCHSSGDKPAVRELYRKLAAEGWIAPWLDEEKLLPGQDWTLEIEKAVEAAHVVIICLTKNSVTKEGFVQRELRLALDIALTKPEETIFVIPLRFEDCEPPRRLRAYHYSDFFPAGEREHAYGRLLASLRLRAGGLGISMVGMETAPAPQKEKPRPVPAKREQKPKSEPARPVERVKAEPKARTPKPVDLRLANAQTWGGIEFVRIPAGPFLMGSKKDNKRAFDGEKPQHTVDLPYDYWLARFPVTNEQYARFIGKGKHPVSGWERKKDHPVMYVKWNDAMAYCRWLNDFLIAELPEEMILRLPTEAEWEKAARGAGGREWPWGSKFYKTKCNSSEGGQGGTTPVGLYSPAGDSPYGCADMVGNVWEWCNSLYQPYPYRADDGRESEAASDYRVLRGGSFIFNARSVRCALRNRDNPDTRRDDYGFRVCIAPVSS